MPWLALLGPDGTGKSTALRTLSEQLAPPITAGVVVYHRRPGVVARAPVRPHEPLYVRPPHSAPASMIKLMLMSVDWFIGYFTVVRPELQRGKLVIFDRHYLTDVLVDPKRYRYGGPRWWAQWLAALTPKPTFFFLLDAPAEVIQARKQEVPYEETVRQRAAYLRLAQDLPQCRVIDANRPVEQVVGDILTALQIRLPGTTELVP